MKNELVAESYQNSMDWIEEEKYYNRMSLADELAAYTRVQQRYAKGTEERKKMDREVYRVQQEIYEARKNYEDELGRIQEEAGEKRLQLEQECADKTKEINDQLAQDIQAAEDKYASALESRTDALYDSYGLFDKVTKKDPVNSSDLMNNLQQQVDEFSDWQKELDLLSSKGLNEGLIEELRKWVRRRSKKLKRLIP